MSEHLPVCNGILYLFCINKAFRASNCELTGPREQRLQNLSIHHLHMLQQGWNKSKFFYWKDLVFYIIQAFVKLFTATCTVDNIHKLFIGWFSSVSSPDRNKVWGVAFLLDRPATDEELKNILWCNFPLNVTWANPHINIYAVIIYFQQFQIFVMTYSADQVMVTAQSASAALL